MSILGTTLFALGWLVIMIGGIMMLVAGFRAGVGWGLAMLFLSPIAQVAFFFTHWDEARQSFFVQLFGMLLLLAGAGGLMRGGLALPNDTASFKEFSLSKGAALVSELADIPGLPGAGEGPKHARRDENDFVGKSLVEVVDALGEPKMMLKVGNETTYRYPDMDLYSDDGVYVTSQGVPTK
jgi:hypothetical protein